MLNKSSLNASVALAAKYADRGLLIQAVPSTPVDKLIQAAHLPVANLDELSLDVETRLLQGSTMKNAAGVVEHDLVMDEVVEVIAQTVSLNLDLARNGVNPMVKSALEWVQESMENITTLRTTAYSVVQDTYGPVWANPAVLDMAERYNETPVVDLKLGLVVPGPADSAGLLELAKTGASRFDQEIAEFWGTLPAGLPEQVYAKLFVTSGDHRLNLLDHLNPQYVDRREVLLIHLFSRKLLQETPEGVNASLADYKAFMSEVVAQSGRALHRILKRRESDRASRVLVREGQIGTVGDTAKIVVNTDVYNPWLDAGGSPELLYGASVHDREYGYQTLLDRRDQYLAAWARQQSVLNTSVRLQRFNDAANAVGSAVSRLILELPDQYRVVDNATYHRRLAEEVGCLQGEFYNDFFCTIRHVVCRVLFPHTDAYQVLKAIDSVKLDNPDLEIREAGLLAVIELVGCWVGKLLRVDAAPTA